MDISDEAWARKKRSEEQLREEGIPVNPNLGPILTEAESGRRSLKEVALRLTSLLLVATKGDGLDQERIGKLVEMTPSPEVLSPRERAFIDDPSPDEDTLDRYRLRHEAIWTLFWVLGQVDELEPPDEFVDPEWMEDPEWTEYIDESAVRPQAEILDEADKNHRYHWAVVAARFKGLPPPGDVLPEIVFERQLIFNWLIDPQKRDWDDITT